MPNLIREFFAVTNNSIFAIQRDENVVNVKKTHQRVGAESNLRIGDVLPSMKYLAVTTSMGIFPYDFVERPEDFPAGIRKLMPGTSMVVALFMHKQSALACLRSNATNVKDPKWMSCTQEVLRALEHDPIIRVSHHPISGFPAEFFA